MPEAVGAKKKRATTMMAATMVLLSVMLLTMVIDMASYRQDINADRALRARSRSAGLRQRGVIGVVLDASFPGDEEDADLVSDAPVAPVDDSEDADGSGAVYADVRDGSDGNEIIGLNDDPAMAYVATGRVYDVQRQGTLSAEKTKTRNYEFPVF
eukprot:765632-Hanusia_phi.AAC.3